MCPRYPVRFDSLNLLRLSEALESLHPSSILEARINERKSIFTINTKNDQTTQSLLRLTSLCVIAFRGFEPGGILYTRLGIMRASAPIRSVRRMGTSTTVRVHFCTPRLTKCAYVGLLCHEMLPFVDRPLQCSRCGHFGHVSAVCKHPLLCLICGGSHSQEKCDVPSRHCINCGKPHEATFFVCPEIQRDRSLCRFCAAHNISVSRRARTSRYDDA